ncbi:MAG: hypothetical protein KC516_02215 [Nanoarchaeota archaeon]|nr:hypothetical protein [Nanoarchaeota archaeon]
MGGELIEITLGKFKSLEGIMAQSFNNDSTDDEIRNSFHDKVPSFNFYSGNKGKVPSKYKVSNVHRYNSDEIYGSGDKIIVGEYCNEGIIVPRTHSIAFNQLYNCTPLISLIKGDEEYISFLHTWAIPGNSEVVDKQVKHWMEAVAKFGDISETVFAPRKDFPLGADTKYQSAIEDITRMSKKAIVLTRNVSELSGITNGKGVYFNDCGYHLWEK